jgi:DNA-binding transcriptional regulator of glucitol operon
VGRGRRPDAGPAPRRTAGPGPHGGTVSPLTGVPSQGAPAVTVGDVYTRLLTPKWVLLHLVVAALFVATFFLGYWQLSKAEAGGGAVNWSYALQWPLYGLMGLWFYVRMCREELNRDPDEDEPGADLVLYQRPRIDTSGDPELAAYNAYLAELNERALRQRAEHGR